MFARDIRERVHDALPEDVLQMLTQMPEPNRHVAEQALDSISDEIMMAANEIVAGEEVQDEPLLLWQSLPSERMTHAIWQPTHSPRSTATTD